MGWQIITRLDRDHLWSYKQYELPLFLLFLGFLNLIYKIQPGRDKWFCLGVSFYIDFTIEHRSTTEATGCES